MTAVAAGGTCFIANLNAGAPVEIPHEPWDDCRARCKAKTGGLCPHEKFKCCARCGRKVTT